jgi:peptidoglycan/LPS O-acetylase OafA/YrhL
MAGVRILCRLFLGSPLEFTLTQFFGDFFLLNGYFLTDVPVNNPMWSLSPEVFAYFVFFACMRYFVDAKIIKRNFVFAGLILLGCLVCGRDIQFLFMNKDFIRVLPGFFAGCFACQLWTKCANRKKSKLILTWICAFVTCIVFGSYFINENLIGNKVFVFSIFGMPALILVILNVPAFFWLLSRKVFKWLGDMSFGLYLYHFPVLTVLFQLTNYGIIGQGIMTNRFIMPGVFAFVLAGAHLSYYYFEQPVQKRIRKLYFTNR